MGFLRPGSSGSRPGAPLRRIRFAPLPTPLLCSRLLLGAPRCCQSERGKKGRYRRSCLRPQPPAPSPARPAAPLPLPRTYQQGRTALRATGTPPHSAPGWPLSPVTRGGGETQKPEPSSLPRARCPHPSLGRGDPSKHPRFLLWAFLPGTGDVCLVRKLEQMEKRPFSLPLLYPREEKPPPFVFDSCPTLHYPGSSRGRKQPLRIQGAGHRRKSIRDKNQLLPESAAAMTRGRGASHPSPGALPPTATVHGRGEDETQTPEENDCSPGLKLRVPDWIARQFRNLTRCDGHLSCSHAL